MAEIWKWSQASRHIQNTPRYTSYPTVPWWSAAEPEAAQDIATRVGERMRPLSVYIHVPFCKRMCLYCGCNVVVAKSYDKVGAYLDALDTELGWWAQTLGRRSLIQLHFGGGTPTFLNPADLEALIGKVLQRFDAQAHAEIGVEVDPSTATPEHLEALRRAGCNRLSVGVQDFDDEVLTRVGRGGRGVQAENVIRYAHALGFESINVDLMYGLPGQTPEQLATNARKCVDLGAQRAAVFGYAHVPSLKPHQKRLDDYTLPDSALRWDMLSAAHNAFVAAGYEPVGLDHYAAPNDTLAQASRQGRLRRNFQGYTVLDEGDVLGLGVSAVSDFDDAYLQNHHRISTYESEITAGALAKERLCVLSPDDKLRRRVISDLMCNLAIDTNAYGIDFNHYFSDELVQLSKLAAQDLVTLGRRIEVNPATRPLIRNVATVFDAYVRAPTRSVVMSTV